MTTPTPPPPPPGTPHSPGPWSIKKTEAYPYDVHLCAANGQYIADITSPIPVLPDKGLDALNQRNLELIRSAPELLAQFEQMVSLVLDLTKMPDAPPLGLGGVFRLEQAEKLIAKVRGQ